MGERFEEVSTKLAVAVVKQVPVLGLLLEAAEAFLPADADDKIRAAVIDEMGDTVIRLQAKVETLAASLEKHGKKLDDIGAMRTVALTREVAEAKAESRSPEKTEAVLNAAARQFDPSLSASTRAHWFAVVRKLTDMQVVAIRLLREHSALLLHGAKLSDGRRGSTEAPFNQFAPAEVLALTEAVETLQAAGRYVSSAPQNGESKYTLTIAGNVLADFLNDPGTT